jgi:hypothetical protein
MDSMKESQGNGSIAPLILSLSSRWASRHGHSEPKERTSRIIEWETRYAPELLWTVWKREGLFPLLGIQLWFSFFQPLPQSLMTTLSWPPGLIQVKNDYNDDVCAVRPSSQQFCGSRRTWLCTWTLFSRKVDCVGCKESLTEVIIFLCSVLSCRLHRLGVTLNLMPCS